MTTEATPASEEKNNIPFIGILWRLRWLVLFMLVANFAANTNFQIVKPRWEHTTTEGWQKGDDEQWHHHVDENWVSVPGKSPFEVLGAVLYVPALMSVVVLCAFVSSDLYFRRTISADIHNDVFLANWKAMTGEERVRYTMIVLCVFLLTSGLVALSVGK